MKIHTPQRAAKTAARVGKPEALACAALRSEFGWIIVAATACGLCWLALAATKKEAEEALRAEFPGAKLSSDPALAAAVEAALAAVEGKGSKLQPALDLRGTPFQLKVWEALRSIPRGAMVTYGELAHQLGTPSATRAVARACAANRIALLVPCHRVVGAGGALTGYRWGIERKRKLLAAEQA